MLNVGPSNTSSFHVVGAIFDRVWFEGNPDNQWRGAQTALLGSSNSAIVEFVVPEKGGYVMVDHHFANASQGAVGIISAGGGSAGDHAISHSDTEHHNIPATAAPTDPLAQRGKLDFESKCLACHTIAGGDKLGPDLYGVTKNREQAWLARWLKEPEQMGKTDPIGKKLLEQWKIQMPDQNLTDQEVKQYLAYFKWADENVKPQGKMQPQPATPGAALPPSQTKSAVPQPGGRQ